MRPATANKEGVILIQDCDICRGISIVHFSPSLAQDTRGYLQGVVLPLAKDLYYLHDGTRYMLLEPLAVSMFIGMRPILPIWGSLAFLALCCS
jgi:hypothetical protein